MWVCGIRKFDGIDGIVEHRFFVDADGVVFDGYGGGAFGMLGCQAWMFRSNGAAPFQAVGFHRLGWVLRYKTMGELRNLFGSADGNEAMFPALNISNPASVQLRSMIPSTPSIPSQ